MFTKHDFDHLSEKTQVKEDTRIVSPWGDQSTRIVETRDLSGKVTEKTESALDVNIWR
ncbi:MAG TPA: hypothetical protein VGO11_07915 [Chthoniobacteraceae bacterium]|jgi:hypothetical protein|nr:hypothetical protein [Chthoniobacteraceae bacterium]